MRIDLAFNISEEGSETSEALLEVSLAQGGSVREVFVGGVRVSGKIYVHEFVELLLGQSYLCNRAQQIIHEGQYALEAHKSMRDLELERTGS